MAASHKTKQHAHIPHLFSISLWKVLCAFFIVCFRLLAFENRVLLFFIFAAEMETISIVTASILPVSQKIILKPEKLCPSTVLSSLLDVINGLYLLWESDLTDLPRHSEIPRTFPSQFKPCFLC